MNLVDQAEIAARFPAQAEQEAGGVDLRRSVAELYRHRELLWIWTLREIKIRYKQSVVGVGWAILQPLVLMLAFTIVFSFLTRMPSEGAPYAVFSYVALLPWTFLATSIAFGVPSLVNNINLVTKIYFPREILPIASVIAAFVDFLVAALVLVGLMWFYGVPVRPAILWVPLAIGIQMALTLGIVFLMAAVNVRYRDIRFLVPLGMQLWMYASPVIYPVNVVPESVRSWYMLNPMSVLIETYRGALLYGRTPHITDIAVTAVISVALLIAGYWHLKRAEGSFADII